MAKRAQTFLLYGETDTGKTSQLGEIAQWEFARTGKVSRLISADSTWDPIIEMVETVDRPLGMSYKDLEGKEKVVCIVAWNIQALPDPWAVMVELSEGSWPVLTGLVENRATLKMTQPLIKNGEILIKGRDGKEWVLGQIFCEGLSTFVSVFLLDHQSMGRKLSQDVVGTFSSKIDMVDAGGKAVSRAPSSFSAASPSHYGQVQRFLLDELVPRFGKAQVGRVVWTAHESKGRDAITGIDKSALGVDAGGPAVVDKVVQKFAHSFHLTSETGFVAPKAPSTVPIAVREFKAWFIKHPDLTLKTMLWPAKISLNPAQSRELLKKFPGGYIPITNEGIGQYLEFISSWEKEKTEVYVEPGRMPDDIGKKF